MSCPVTFVHGKFTTTRRSSANIRMANANDPGGFREQAEKNKRKLREQLQDPNKTEFLKTIKSGSRGKLSPKSWAQKTISNHVRSLPVVRRGRG